MFLILTPDIVLCTFFRSFQMRHFTHIWQNPPDFFARYQVITFQHCIKAQEKVFRYISTSQLDDLNNILEPPQTWRGCGNCGSTTAPTRQAPALALLSRFTSRPGIFRAPSGAQGVLISACQSVALLQPKVNSNS